ncbi:hypothetical protein [Photobacterium kishitanii]|uniref:Uncharacterized protein n=1 Tax=Photobacterium kishitanii TaxID=318456 RepID=A0A2T3KLK3_9GAMM|nr:hypothetical protein [Photobacterium kishitanii]PSV00556.1 hypothetical protein C9J27_05320 [Photobacterium kishitanii]
MKIIKWLPLSDSFFDIIVRIALYVGAVALSRTVHIELTEYSAKLDALMTYSSSEEVSSISHLADYASKYVWFIKCLVGIEIIRYVILIRQRLDANNGDSEHTEAELVSFAKEKHFYRLAFLILVVTAPLTAFVMASNFSIEARKAELVTISNLTKSGGYRMPQSCKVTKSENELEFTCKFWNPTVIEAALPWVNSSSIRNATFVLTISQDKKHHNVSSRTFPNGLNGVFENHKIPEANPDLYHYSPDPILNV